MTRSDPEATSRSSRKSDPLKLVHQYEDDEGHLITTVTGPFHVEFRVEDLGQLLAGACVMALPISLTEEVWNLGESLSVGRTLGILGFSLLTLAAFIWGLFYGGKLKQHRGQFVLRVLSTYLVTFFVAMTLLLLFDKAPLDDLPVALTRTVIVAFPAAFAATAVDFIK